MDGEKVRWPKGGMKVQRFQIRWEPAHLLYRMITLSAIDIGRMAVKDERPATSTPPDLIFPKVKILPSFLQLETGSFTLKELPYRRL